MTPATTPPRMTPLARAADLRARAARRKTALHHLAGAVALIALSLFLSHCALKSARILSEDIARATAEGLLQ